jgi:hypothetical protein
MQGVPSWTRLMPNDAANQVGRGGARLGATTATMTTPFSRSLTVGLEYRRVT